MRTPFASRQAYSITSSPSWRKLRGVPRPALQLLLLELLARRRHRLALFVRTGRRRMEEEQDPNVGDRLVEHLARAFRAAPPAFIHVLVPGGDRADLDLRPKRLSEEQARAARMRPQRQHVERLPPTPGSVPRRPPRAASRAT